MDIMYGILNESMKNMKILGKISFKPEVKYNRFSLPLLS